MNHIRHFMSGYKESWWADETRKVFCGNIPGAHKECQVWRELESHNIVPLKMKHRLQKHAYQDSFSMLLFASPALATDAIARGLVQHRGHVSRRHVS